MVRVPEHLKDFSEPRHEIPVIGPFIALGEGLAKICLCLPLGILTSWLYVVEKFTDKVVVPRYFDFVRQGFELIIKKGLSIGNICVDEDGQVQSNFELATEITEQGVARDVPDDF